MSILTRTLAQSFVGGEVTPEFWGRLDDQKFQTGLATCRNFQVLPHGPAQNRAGFQFVHEVKDSTAVTRLLPFTYSTTQTMVLEFGNQYIRFHTQGAILLTGTVPAYNAGTAYAIGDLASSGGVNYYCIAPTTGNAPPNGAYWYAMPAGNIYEIPTPYVTADLFDIHYVQSADVLTLVHPNYPVMELQRLGATDWLLAAVQFQTALEAPTGVMAQPYVPTGTTNLILCEYAVTSVGATVNADESLPSNSASGNQTLAITGITKANPGVITISSTTFALQVGQQVLISGVGGMTQLNGNTYYVGVVNNTSYPYGYPWGGGGSVTITTLTLNDANGNPIDTSSFGAYTSGGTITLAGVMNNLDATNAFNSISWTPVAGITTYNVYKKSNGLWGFIGQTTQTSFKDDNITPNVGQTPPIASNPFNSAGNYPGAVSYYEQRRCFAGTIDDPQNIWMTKSGTESNMSYSLPTQDSDSIAFRVASLQANTIRHIVPLLNLVLLTSSAEWRVASLNSDALTPSDFDVKPQSYIGANNAPPVIVNNALLYTAARGGHVREMGYSWEANGYVTGDVSLRAPHLVDGYDITDMTFGKAPYPFMYAVSTSGKLLGLTYVPEQQIGAWHWFDTGISGTDVFEACTVVAEGDRDVLYVIVNRNINGVHKRYVERQAARLFTDQTQAFFVDAGLTYSGAPAEVISGFNHLIGMTVSILADGAVMAPQVVDNTGSITLPQAASVVTAGIPITADLVTLPIAVSPYIAPGYGQGRPKNVNKAFIRVYNSRGLKAGPDTTTLVEDKERTTEPYGSPPSLQSREIEIVLTPAWSDGGSITVRQDQPLPSTIVSICYEVQLGG